MRHRGKVRKPAVNGQETLAAITQGHTLGRAWPSGRLGSSTRAVHHVTASFRQASNFKEENPIYCWGLLENHQIGDRGFGGSTLSWENRFPGDHAGSTH